jgi:hypothetical protein
MKLSNWQGAGVTSAAVKKDGFINGANADRHVRGFAHAQTTNLMDPFGDLSRLT